MKYSIYSKWILVISFLLFFISPCLAAIENLDEMVMRKDRKNTNQFYSGESEANNYLWQPQTLCYTDIETGHEVWVITLTDNANAYSGHEYGHQPWSADGRYFALALDRDTNAFTRGNYFANELWLTMESNGSMLRPRVDAPARTRVHAYYTHWSPVEPNIYYEFGRAYSGEGMSSGTLYKVTLNNDGIVNSTPWITYADIQRDLPKDAISSDGKFALATAFSETGIIAIGNVETRALELPEYTLARNLDNYWYGTDSVLNKSLWHDEMFVGAGGDYWIYFLYTTGSWWRMRPWGGNVDGGPTHTADSSSSQYDWKWWTGTASEKEIQPVNGIQGNLAFNNNYWSHGVPDRWGNHFLYSDTQGAYVAPGVCNVDTDTRTAFPGEAKGAQYHAWTGWTDLTTGTNGADYVYSMKYNDGATHKKIASMHATTGTMFVKPGQSPDGTKTAFRSDWLQPSTTNGDIFYVVAEYPHPPEITQVTGNETYTIRFDWRLGETTSRGYTSRGWPKEGSDNPPAPRETKEFRLWRSPNGTSDWVPVKTIAANPFDKFDYVNGGLKIGQTAYWEITDAPEDGTWYYAVTSIEHSGLESRTLSNVFSSTGSQSAVYPSNPGSINLFYSQLPPTPELTSEVKATAGHYQLSWVEAQDPMVRYYNIYYSTSDTPEPIQQNLIASVPVGTTSYLDWLANPSVLGYYSITSVDYQGNASSGGGGDIEKQPPPAVEAFKELVMSGSTCTQWVTQTTSDDEWTYNTYTYQPIKNSVLKTVCEVDVELWRITSDAVAHVEFWSDDARTGTQYGADSDTETISVTSGGTFYTFSWSGTQPSFSGDAYLHVIYDSGGTLVIRSNTDKASYEDTDYDLYMNSTTGNPDKGADLSFTIRTEQY